MVVRSDPNTGDEAFKKVPIFNAWQRNANARKYQDVIFSPMSPDGLASIPQNVLNLFSGYNNSDMGSLADLEYEDENGFNLINLLNHIYRHVCKCNPIQYKIFISFFAHKLQNPEDKLNIAMILQSIEGTGKTLIMKLFAKIFDPYSICVCNKDMLVGNFNYLSNYTLLLLDEQEYIDPAEQGKIRGIVTDEKLLKHEKYERPELVDNWLDLIVITNKIDHSILREGRRYHFYQVSPDISLDKQYFTKLAKYVRRPEAVRGMAYYLKNIEIPIPDIAHMDPVYNLETEEKVLEQMPKASLFIYECLQNETFRLSKMGILCSSLFIPWRQEMNHEGGNQLESTDDRLPEKCETEIPNVVGRQDLFNNFREWCRFKNIKYVPSMMQFIVHIRNLFGLECTQMHHLRDEFVFPPLQSARKKFSTIYKQVKLLDDDEVEYEENRPNIPFKNNNTTSTTTTTTTTTTINTNQNVLL
ncbi:MAG: primase-helicase family protein [Promethearchaeota archaeon]